MQILRMWNWLMIKRTKSINLDWWHQQKHNIKIFFFDKQEIEYVFEDDFSQFICNGDNEDEKYRKDNFTLFGGPLSHTFSKDQTNSEKEWYIIASVKYREDLDTQGKEPKSQKLEKIFVYPVSHSKLILLRLFFVLTIQMGSFCRNWNIKTNNVAYMHLLLWEYERRTQKLCLRWWEWGEWKIWKQSVQEKISQGKF